MIQSNLSHYLLSSSTTLLTINKTIPFQVTKQQIRQYYKCTYELVPQTQFATVNFIQYLEEYIALYFSSPSLR